MKVYGKHVKKTIDNQPSKKDLSEMQIHDDTKVILPITNILYIDHQSMTHAKPMPQRNYVVHLS